MVPPARIYGLIDQFVHPVFSLWMLPFSGAPPMQCWYGIFCSHDEYLVLMLKEVH